MTTNLAAIVAKQIANFGPVPLDLPKLHLPRIPAAIQIIAVKHYAVYVEDVVEACIAAQERSKGLAAKYAPAIPQ